METAWRWPRGAAMALHEPEGELRVGAACGAIAPAAGGAPIAKEPEGDARVGAVGGGGHRHGRRAVRRPLGRRRQAPRV